MPGNCWRRGSGGGGLTESTSWRKTDQEGLEREPIPKKAMWDGYSTIHSSFQCDSHSARAAMPCCSTGCFSGTVTFRSAAVPVRNHASR